MNIAVIGPVLWDSYMKLKDITACIWNLSFVQEVHNINTSAGIPYPFNETIDTAAYLGFEKLSDNGQHLADYIKVSLRSMHLCFSALQCAESERVCYCNKRVVSLVLCFCSEWYWCSVRSCHQYLSFYLILATSNEWMNGMEWNEWIYIVPIRQSSEALAS